MGPALGGNQIEGAAAIFIVASGRLITLITAGRSRLRCLPWGGRRVLRQKSSLISLLFFFRLPVSGVSLHCGTELKGA